MSQKDGIAGDKRDEAPNVHSHLVRFVQRERGILSASPENGGYLAMRWHRQSLDYAVCGRIFGTTESGSRKTTNRFSASANPPNNKAT